MLAADARPREGGVMDPEEPMVVERERCAAARTDLDPPR